MTARIVVGYGALMIGTLGAIWAVLGLSLILGRAILSLTGYVLELGQAELAWFHWVLMSLWIFFMVYAEGYRGFQLRFSPRCAARALYLKRHPSVMRVVLAPLFCMGFFHATRRRKIVSYSLTAMIVTLVILVGKLDQPWRGMVDTGVVLGLGWGLVTFWLCGWHAFFGQGFDASPEMPEGM